MKRLIITLLAATGLSGAALASDLPRYGAEPYYAASAFTWSGFYVGLNAGYGWNNSDDAKIRDLHGPLSYGFKKQEDGFTGGLQVGYNYQTGNMVFGLEADLNFANFENRQSGFGNYLRSAETYSVNSKTDWFGTIRPRIGFAATERLLIFATGGLAIGQVKIDGGYTRNGFILSADDSGSRWGWTLGAGLEYGITDNITVKGEYAYVDLGEKTYTWVGRTNFNVMNVTDSTSFQLLRAGVNYKF